MKYLLLSSLLLISGIVSAERIFVSPTGSQDASGTSWEETTDLATATERAGSKDEIWVMQGTYLPTMGTDRSISFRLAAGVELYGGFAGTENELHQRSQVNRSVLSGNIGQPTLDSDNSYTVITLLADTDAGTLLDGFVITGGVARSFTKGFGSENAGGGLFIKAGKGFLPAHLIVNCDFVDNKGHNGAGVYVAAGNSSFEQCSFRGNLADFKGGAVYNQGAGSETNVHFLDCHFEGNAAKYGGAMANNGENGVTTPLLIRCAFVRNVAKTNAAAIYNMTNETGECSVITENCLFDGNTSILGDDVFTKGDKKTLASRQQDANNAGIIISGAARK